MSAEIATSTVADQPTEEDIQLVDQDAVNPQGEPCAACGCPVETGDHFCPACGCPREQPDGELRGVSRDGSVGDRPEHLGGSVGDRPEQGNRPEDDADVPDQIHFRCEGCGAEVATDPGQLSYVCPFCDSTYVVEYSPEETGRQKPEFVIGFSITPEAAQKKFLDWLQTNSWFRPGDLIKAQVAEKMKGVYLPFWAFSMLAQSSWSASIGEHWYRTETYTTQDANGKTVTKTRQVQETEWWPLVGRHHRYYSGFLVSGSRGLPQALAERIKPFQLPALKRYQPYFLAGWFAEEYSVERDAALQTCQQYFYQCEQGNVGAFMPGDTHRRLEVRTNFSKVTSDLCLLPVYVLSYRYRDKLYRFLVNGQTGRCDGDKPVSWARIWAAVGIVGFLLLVIILLFALLAGG